MTLWRKQAVGYWLNPKIVAAGQDAGLVFQALLDVHAELGRDGVLEARAASVATIHSRLPHMSRKRVLRGLEAAVRENLVAIAQDGATTILGWDDEWRPRKALPDLEVATCTRCGGPKTVDAYRQCDECRDYDRARRAARMPQENRSGTGADVAADPQRIPAATPRGFRSGSADLNGTGTLSGCSEEERREDQSRQEVRRGGGRPDTPLSEDQNGDLASLSSPSRAAEVASIVEKTARKLARNGHETAGKRERNASETTGERE